ncbi:MAG: DUF2059 domain-containing protein [Muribaculaceae bacterium]
MKKFLACLLLVFAGSVIASAQTTTTADKTYRAEVEQILEATHVKALLQSTIAKTWATMNIPISDVNAAATGVVDDLWPDLVNIYTDAYYKYLSIEDLRALNAFYSTPRGKRIASSLQSINDESMKATQALLPKIMTSLSKYIDQ